jgi:hypothetical protein
MGIPPRSTIHILGRQFLDVWLDPVIDVLNYIAHEHLIALSLLRQSYWCFELIGITPLEDFDFRFGKGTHRR